MGPETIFRDYGSFFPSYQWIDLKIPGQHSWRLHHKTEGVPATRLK